MLAKRSIAVALTSILLVPQSAAAQTGARSPDSQAPSPLVLAMVERAAKKGGWLKVTLRDRRVMTGFVLSAASEEFTLERDDTDTIETIAYSSVKHVKGRPTLALIKIAVGVGAVIGTIVLITALALPKT